MIIPAEKANRANDDMTDTHRVDPPLDPPPSYTPLQPAGRRQASAEPPVVQRSTLPKPCNFLSLYRPNNTIRGTYTIDPDMYIPPSFLPPLGPGESENDRKNLKLESANGLIDVEIFLLGQRLGDGTKPIRRTTVVAKTANGTINISLNTSATPRNPFYLSAFTDNGTVTVRLPRSFKGLLTTTAANGSTVFSDGLTGQVTVFSEINSTKRCFVGDLSEWTEGEGGWTGDEVSTITKSGRVKVMYTDEGQVRVPPTRGFFSRAMGL